MRHPHIRAKFIVSQASDVKQRVAVNPSQTDKNADDYGKWEIRKVHEDVVLAAVYESGAPTAENVRFAKSTPTGQMSMRIDNPGAWGLLLPGDEFYVDFTPAPLKCKNCFGQGRKYDDKQWADCPRCNATGNDPEQPDDEPVVGSGRST